jgi:hypothetical protein
VSGLTASQAPALRLASLQFARERSWCKKVIQLMLDR